MCGGTPLQRIGEGDWEIEVDEEERVERRGKGTRGKENWQ